jgi:hypothetical protein
MTWRTYSPSLASRPLGTDSGWAPSTTTAPAASMLSTLGGGGGRTSHQGLTLALFRAQLEDLLDTSLTLQLNLSTFGTYPRVHLGCMGDKVSLT